MSRYDIEVVGKIGSMALIQKEEGEIDYNVFARIGRELRPGMIWISSGATEIGRLDYLKRNGGIELDGNNEEVKQDYSAQGQSVLMENYRKFIRSDYSIRQLLVEHTHFNNAEKREHIRSFLIRSAKQKAIPIINYNDPVSLEEIRHMELMSFMKKNKDEGFGVVECIDNDETAAVICSLVHPKYLVILSSLDGILSDPNDPKSLVGEISGKNSDEVIENIREYQKSCVGASRKGANGAKAKLEFCINPVLQGTIVYIASAKYKLSDIINSKVNSTRIGIR